MGRSFRTDPFYAETVRAAKSGTSVFEALKMNDYRINQIHIMV